MSRVTRRLRALAFVGAASILFDGAHAACTLRGIDECIQNDPATAAEFLERQLADTEYVSLILLAGVFYRDAPEPIRDEGRAVEYFERAAKLGEPWASFMLAKMMIDGDATGTSNQVIDHLTEAKTKGMTLAGLELGIFYRHQGDFEAALSELQAVAEKEAGAMIILADMLTKGEGTAADPERAVTLLEQAAEAGVKSPAFKALGDYYLGIDKDQGLAVAFQQAAEAGHGWAKVALARMLIESQGTSADHEKARELLQSALEQNGISHAYIPLIELAARKFPNYDALALGLSLLRDAYVLDPVIAMNAFEFLQPSDKTAIMQAMLLGEKHYLGPIDGIWGRETMRAIGAFCTKNAVAECASDRMSVAVVGALFNQLSQRSPDTILVAPNSIPPTEAARGILPQPESRLVPRRQSARASEESPAAPVAASAEGISLPPALLPTRPPRVGASPAN